MTIERTSPEFLAVVRGDAPADLLLHGGFVVNVFTREILRASVAVYKGRIASVGPDLDAKERFDLQGACVIPGFIDAHMHLESTMLLPAEFVRVALPHATLGVVFDPHEIANVMGADGIRLLMDRARGLPMHIRFAVSSCVPSSPLETAGARLEADDLAPFFDDDRVVALAEMMNFPGVVNADPGVMAKVRLGLARAIVDGHCPGLRGSALQAYAAAGVSSEHESTTADEALEKVRAGMQVYIREGSAARNLEALLPAVTPENAHRFCFCTDDRHPGDLMTQGHIDHAVRRAIALGLDPATAIAMGSLHTAEHYALRDLGAVAPGRLASIAVVDDARSLRIRRVYHEGTLVAEHGRCLIDLPRQDDGALGRALGTVRLPRNLSAASLRAPAPRNDARIRVVGLQPGQITTDALELTPTVEGGACVADTTCDLLKLAVIDRHTGEGRVGVGFAHGFGLKRGAIASTVGHDAHNLTVLGTNDADMLAAAQALAKAGGGQCAVENGRVLALLPLPIAGLMSPDSAERIAEQQRALHEATKALGCPMDDPFMPLSFVPLPVIPSLRVTDLGVVDVNRFKVVPLEVGPE